MMFRWEPDMVRFMRDASERGDYHDRLAAIVCNHAGNADCICDAGCGLGYLSNALSKHFPSVRALDISENAIAVAKTVNAGLKNVTVSREDIVTFTPDVPFDAAVFCFFGRTEEILRFAKRTCGGRVIVIKKNWAHHRFTVAKVPLKHTKLYDLQRDLGALAIPYRSEEHVLEFGQPLRSEADAVRFFQVYSRDEHPENITFSDIAPRLVRTDDPTFPLYLPEQKRIGVVSFEAKDIP